VSEVVAVETLEQLFARRVTPEARSWHEATITVLSAPTSSNSTKAWGAYEDEVFNFLLANCEPLGLANILTFRSLLMDGAVEFADGRRLALEIKYRMNWEKACQAEWQFRNFLKRPEAEQGPVVGGLVFFEDFSADWKRKPASRTLENGWNYWYEGHCEVEGLPLHLVRLRAGQLDAFPEVHR
jgi:hypothetical protein